MERFVEGDLKSPSEFSQRLLTEARNYFQKAVDANPKCKQAILNLALVETRIGQAAEANKLYEKVRSENSFSSRRMNFAVKSRCFLFVFCGVESRFFTH